MPLKNLGHDHRHWESELQRQRAAETGPQVPESPFFPAARNAPHHQLQVGPLPCTL